MWWLITILGAASVLISAILYRYRDSLNVKYKGGSPKTLTIWGITSGSVFIVLGVLGFFFPKVLVWVKVYSETSENISTTLGVLGFLAVQALLVFGLLYIVVYKRLIRRKESELVPGILILGALSAIYWVWIIWSGNVDKGFKEPFRYLYKLIHR